MKKITAIISLLLLVCMLASCASCTRKFKTVSGGYYYDEENDVVYSIAPSYYEANYWEKEVYMEDEHGFEYYKVTDKNGQAEDPPVWLYNYENNILLYNSDMTLPTLKEMNPTTLSFYEENSKKIYITVDDDVETVRKVVSLLDGPSMNFYANEVQQSYKMSFSSSAYPCIEYVLVYMECTKDQYEYVSLKGQNYSSVEEIEAGYDFIDGVPYEIIIENDGSFTVAYNYGRYFIYNRDLRKCYMAAYVHEIYNAYENSSESGAV